MATLQLLVKENYLEEKKITTQFILPINQKQYKYYYNTKNIQIFNKILNIACETFMKTSIFYNVT